MAPRRTSVFQAHRVPAPVRARLLVIIVSPDGDVQNRVIFTEVDYTQSQLIEAANFSSTPLRGPGHRAGARTAQGTRSTLRGEIATDAGCRQGQLGGLDPGAGRGGDFRRAQPAWPSATFPATWASCAGPSTCSSRRPSSCACWTSPARQRACGSTSAARARWCRSKSCRIVSAPYEVDGRWSPPGTLGVIGPTRMPYDRMIQIVDITSKLVSNALSHHK
jgi:heat-inducible transcriptional repressor